MEGLWRRNGGHWRWWCTHCHQLPWESVWIETQEFYLFVRFALYLIVGPLLIYLFLLLKKSRAKMFHKLFQMQYLNSLMKLNRRLTRSCRLGIALTSWTRLNFVKLAPAHTGACFGLTLSRENALTKRPGITGAAQIFVWTPTFQNDSTESRQKKRDNDEWRALPRLLCDTKDWELMQQTRGEKSQTGKKKRSLCWQVK